MSPFVTDPFVEAVAWLNELLDRIDDWPADDREHVLEAVEAERPGFTERAS